MVFEANTEAWWASRHTTESGNEVSILSTAFGTSVSGQCWDEGMGICGYSYQALRRRCDSSNAERAIGEIMKRALSSNENILWAVLKISTLGKAEEIE